MWNAESIDEFCEEIRNQEILEAMDQEMREQEILSGSSSREEMTASTSHTTDISTELSHLMEGSQSQYGQSTQIDMIMYPQDNILINQMQQLRRNHEIEEHTYLVIKAKDYAKLRKSKEKNNPYKVLYVQNNYVFDQIFDKN